MIDIETTNPLTADEVTQVYATSDHLRVGRLATGCDDLDGVLLLMLESDDPTIARMGSSIAAQYAQFTPSGELFVRRMAEALEATSVVDPEPEADLSRSEDIAVVTPAAELPEAPVEPAPAKETVDPELHVLSLLTYEEKNELQDWIDAVAKHNADIEKLRLARQSKMDEVYAILTQGKPDGDYVQKFHELINDVFHGEDARYAHGRLTRFIHEPENFYDHALDQLLADLRTCNQVMQDRKAAVLKEREEERAARKAAAPVVERQAPPSVPTWQEKHAKIPLDPSRGGGRVKKPSGEKNRGSKK